MKANCFQVNIDDRKAYTISFYHTTSRITVNGQKMQRAFIEEDYPTILEHLSGLTNRKIWEYTGALKEAIARAKALPETQKKSLEGLPAPSSTTSATGISTTLTVSQPKPASTVTTLTTATQGHGPSPPSHNIPALHHSTHPVVGPPPREPTGTPNLHAAIVPSTTSSVVAPALPPSTQVRLSVPASIIRPISPIMSTGFPLGVPMGPTPVSIPLSGSIQPHTNTTSTQAAIEPNLSTTTTVSSAATSGSATSASSTNGPSANSKNGTQTRKELAQIEKLKKELKQKDRELEESKIQASRSKAMAMDLEARLKETTESLRFQTLLNRGNPAKDPDARRDRQGINGDWRKRDDRDRSHRAERDRYSSGDSNRENWRRRGDRDRSHRMERDRYTSGDSTGRFDYPDGHSREWYPHRERSRRNSSRPMNSCCNANCGKTNAQGNAELESRVARLEQKMLEHRMEDLERRLVEMERQKRQRTGRRRPRRAPTDPQSRRRNERAEYREEGSSRRNLTDIGGSDQSQNEAFIMRDATRGNLDSTSLSNRQDRLNRSSQRDGTISEQSDSSTPRTSSPIHRRPTPPFQVPEDNHDDSTDDLQSSEQSFLEVTVLANRST